MTLFPITIQAVDPSVFNFGSDIFALLWRMAMGFSLSFLYILILGWQLRSRQNIPVSGLGKAPQDWFAAGQLARTLHWSWPALVLLSLYMVADFSHSLADLGLRFETIEMQGDDDFVLDLSRRNRQRLIQTAGDPAYVPRNAHITTKLFSDDDGVVEIGRSQDRLLNGFLDAVDLIASGGSPFVENRPAPPVNHDLQSLLIFGRYHTNKSLALAEMDVELPLECASDDNIVEIEQTAVLIPAGEYDRFVNFSQQVTFTSTASVPNCTFTAFRSTGIYGGSRASVSVLEYGAFASGATTEQIFLTKQGVPLPRQFLLTPSDKRLARDRTDWRNGRSITNSVDGIRIGADLQVDLGAVVMATGPEFLPFDIENTLGTEIEWIRRSLYGLVGEVLGDCPQRPSGLPMERDLECILFASMFCVTFEEDYQLIPQQDMYLGDSSCELQTVSLVWGVNFKVDADLVATMAGLYGRIQPNVNLRQLVDFQTNAILAAKFATASISSMPSINQHVKAQINGVYIVFMLLPVLLSFTIMLVVWKARNVRLPIPTNSWELLVFGREEINVPTRSDRTEDFPVLDQDLTLSLMKHKTNQKLLVVVSSRNLIESPQNDTPQAPVEVLPIRKNNTGSYHTNSANAEHGSEKDHESGWEDEQTDGENSDCQKKPETECKISLDPSGIYQP